MKTLATLKTWLVYAECRAASNDWIERAKGRDEVRKLKARIARRERAEAYKDLGLTKVKGALGGTYYE